MAIKTSADVWFVEASMRDANGRKLTRAEHREITDEINAKMNRTKWHDHKTEVAARETALAIKLLTGFEMYVSKGCYISF